MAVPCTGALSRGTPRPARAPSSRKSENTVMTWVREHPTFITEMRNTGTLILIPSVYNDPVGAVQKADRSWKQFQGLNEVVCPPLLSWADPDMLDQEECALGSRLLYNPGLEHFQLPFPISENRLPSLPFSREKCSPRCLRGDLESLPAVPCRVAGSTFSGKMCPLKYCVDSQMTTAVTEKQA